MPFRGNGRNPSEKSRTTELSVKLPLKELKGGGGGGTKGDTSTEQKRTNSINANATETMNATQLIILLWLCDPRIPPPMATKGSARKPPKLKQGNDTKPL